MANKSIEMQVLNGSGTYDALYPKTLGQNTIISDSVATEMGLSSGATVDQALSTLQSSYGDLSKNKADSGFNIGDFKVVHPQAQVSDDFVAVNSAIPWSEFTELSDMLGYNHAQSVYSQTGSHYCCATINNGGEDALHIRGISKTEIGLYRRYNNNGAVGTELKGKVKSLGYTNSQNCFVKYNRIVNNKYIAIISEPYNDGGSRQEGIISCNLDFSNINQYWFPQNQNMNNFIYYKGYYLAFFNSNFYSSSDLKTWTVNTHNLGLSSGNLQNMNQQGQMYVDNNNTLNFIYYNGTKYTTTNPLSTTWTKTSWTIPESSNYMRQVYYDNDTGGLYVTTENSLFVSYDMSTWKRITYIGTQSEHCNFITKINGKLYCAFTKNSLHIIENDAVKQIVTILLGKSSYNGLVLQNIAIIGNRIFFSGQGYDSSNMYGIFDFYQCSYVNNPYNNLNNNYGVAYMKYK